MYLNKIHFATLNKKFPSWLPHLVSSLENFRQFGWFCREQLRTAVFEHRLWKITFKDLFVQIRGILN